MLLVFGWRVARCITLRFWCGVVGHRFTKSYSYLRCGRCEVTWRY